ncbi:T9SS type A sorting domain-containing protein [candidate division KSB1 bacterium]|nr:T9SS type A sorting domain-containing protein [candidate division KSB1 bacterium]
MTGSSGKTVAIFLLFLIHPVFGINKSDGIDHDWYSLLAEQTHLTISPCGFYKNFKVEQNGQLTFQKDILKKTSSEPPQLQDSTKSLSGHFMLHYNRTGIHAVPLIDLSSNGVPDYIDSAGVILDHVREIEINTLGFQPPLNVEGKPASTYHVYFSNLNDSYGVTYNHRQIPDDQGLIRYTSYMVLDNDYAESSFTVKGLDALKVTAAHEFNHAIQMSYRVWWDDDLPVDFYFMEMTSTWIEDVVYEHINRYVQYLPYLFDNFSNTPFNFPEYLYPYGNSLFLHMLEKEFGSGIVPEIWERIKVKNSLYAIPEILARYGTTFSYQLHQYGIWMFFTGDRADNISYFPEGHLYPQVRIKPDDIYHYKNEMTILKFQSPLSNRFIKMNIPENRMYVSTAYSDMDNSFITYFESDKITASAPFNQQIVLYPEGDSPLELLLTNSGADTATIKYTVQTDIDKPAQLIQVFPNPVKLNDDSKLTFRNVPAGGNIYIYTVDGHKISELAISPGASSAFWNLRDEQDNDISTGIYLYLIKGNDIEKSGKIVVIR